MKKASVVVVPMYSGAGVQNKIIEAMSIGCCVVTTEIGAEGLEGLLMENISLSELIFKKWLILL